MKNFRKLLMINFIFNKQYIRKCSNNKTTQLLDNCSKNTNDIIILNKKINDAMKLYINDINIINVINKEKYNNKNNHDLLFILCNIGFFTLGICTAMGFLQ